MVGNRESAKRTGADALLQARLLRDLFPLFQRVQMAAGFFVRHFSASSACGGARP